MAKGLRSSIKKAHRTTLRARVFQPVENERAERIHAKLLEIVQQPKPEAPKKSEMEVDTEGTPRHSPPLLTSPANSDFPDAAASEEQKDDNAPQGSCFLTAKIPRSLTCSTTKNTPPSAKEDRDMENLCFYLGLSSDIVGFTENRDLELAFDPLPPQWLMAE